MTHTETAPQATPAPGAPEPERTAPAPDPDAVPETPRRRWCKATRITLSAATAWLGFVGVHYLLSGRWWAWELIELLPPPVFLLVPLVLALVPAVLRLARRRLPTAAAWWLAVALVAALGLGSSIAGINLHALWGGQSSPAPPDALRVATWNTEHWNHKEDKDDIYTFLRAQDADVYLLQEYLYRGGQAPYSIDASERLSREFPEHELVDVGGLLTLSRYPIEAWEPISVSLEYVEDFQANGWFDYWQVKALRTDVRIGTETVSFYNLHLPTPVQFRYDPSHAEFYSYTREAHAWRKAVIEAISSDLSGNCGPIVVAGDFNATSLRRDIHQLDPRLSDAIPASDRLYPGTWSLDGSDLSLWRLDYAYTTPELRVHEYGFRDSAGMSDHDAQYLVLSLDDSAEPAAGACAGSGR